MECLELREDVEGPQVREKNTLTISIGSDTWTYTFDKTLPLGADINQVMKALKDTQEVFILGLKAELALAIWGIGGSVPQFAKWEEYFNAINSMGFGSAVASQVLAPQTIRTKDGLVTGTMPDYSLLPNNNGYVTAKSTKADGQGSIVMEPQSGYYKTGLNVNGYGTLISVSPHLIPANFRADKNIFGMQGSIPIRNEGNGVAGGNHHIHAGLSASDGVLFVKPTGGIPILYEGDVWLKVTDPNYNPANIRNGVPIFGQVGTMVEGNTMAGSAVVEFNNGGSYGDIFKLTNTFVVSSLNFTPSMIFIRVIGRGGDVTQSYGYYKGTLWGDVNGGLRYLLSTVRMNSNGFSFADAPYRDNRGSNGGSTMNVGIEWVATR